MYLGLFSFDRERLKCDINANFEKSSDGGKRPSRWGNMRYNVTCEQ